MTPNETKRFKPLYNKFMQALTLQGLSESTIDGYSRGVRRVATYFDCCPDTRLTQDQLKEYFADLLDTHSWSTIKLDLNGLKQYWRHVLNHDWDWVLIVKPPQSRTLPDILTQNEIAQILAAVNKRRYAVFLYTVYSMGLRLGECLSLKVGDIDGEKMRVHIRDGKGHKDRYVLLPMTTYRVLQQFWLTHRHPQLIFPSMQTNRQNVPMDRGSIQRVMKLAVEACHIHKTVTIHSLRHCYATHLIENGLNLRAVQELLGHDDARTTALYTQLTEVVQQNTSSIINSLMASLPFDANTKKD